MVQFSVRNRATTLDQPRLPLLPPALTALLKRTVVQVQGLLVTALGIALLLALISYDANDPSLNTAVSNSSASAIVINNWLGSAGALLADLTLQWFGTIMGWMIGLALVILGWRLTNKKRAADDDDALTSNPGMKPRRIIWPMGKALWGVVSLGLMIAPLALGVALLATSPAITISWLTLGATWQLAAEFLNPLVTASLGATGSIILAGILVACGGVMSLIWAGLRPQHLNLAWQGTAMGATTGATKSIAGIGGLMSELRRRSTDDETVAEPADDPEITVEDDSPALARSTGPTLELPGKKPAAIEIDADEAPKRKAKAAQTAQPSLGLKSQAKTGTDEAYEAPPLALLHAPSAAELADQPTEDALQANAGLLEGVLADFGVKGEIQKVRPGPVVTLYELEPAPGTKSQRVIGIADDIARSMSAISARVAVVPGKNAIGIELPNDSRQTVWLHEVLADRSYHTAKAKLPLALGKDIGGDPVIADLARMPHLLVAGTTGSGKSVAVNTMILSLLYRLSPEQCRFIMIDPKMLELSVYGDIPHLLCPVVTEPKKAVVALKWVVREMEDRYRAMSKLSVRNIDGYNQRIVEARKKGEVLTRKVQTGFDPDTGKPVIEEEPIELVELPYIVVIVDEFADLMLVAGKEIEAAIQRLAQMARAAGIHLIMATQRPSVDVITGTIKANFPTRISFAVTSKIDSRTILGEQGAEQLLGMGDMLYMAAGGRINRVHGPFVKDEEVETIVKHLRDLAPPDYIDAVTDESGFEESEMLAAAIGEDGASGGNSDSGDELFDRAVDLIARERKASTSFIQRHLQIGYNRAARIIEEMEKQGMVSAANHVGKRDVLLPDRRGEE
ncbi:MAG: DNA translocase FtsK 4TM domain-containing protein [Pseudomonadota bacterium]